MFIRAGANLEAKIESTGATPLMMAARAGREAVVKLLLERGADVHAKGTRRIYQSSAIILAAQGS